MINTCFPVVALKEPISISLLFGAILIAVTGLLSSCTADKRSRNAEEMILGSKNVALPPGFFLEPATLPGMVSYPMFATFDNDGRLFVIESSGKTTSTEDVLENPAFSILLLEDKDDDGVFDKRTVFADKLPYPMGGTFHQGSFYATAPPDLLRLTDTDSDGVADKREIILTGWTLNHNAATLSGPFFGPDGWMYMCDARRGFNITTKEGTQLTGKGARIWRCRPDGTGLEWVSGGGFDNTIEMVFMPSGETIGTMTYFTDPQDGFRDALMHWVEGGVYPKPYAVIEEDRLKLTGDLMPVMTKFARVSPAGLMRYRETAFGKDYTGNLFSAQFNTGRIMRHKVSEDGATFRTVDETFLQYENIEMHPTDVLEDADGSLLVVNTGGWFIAGCPLSVVAKEGIHGSIVRIRKKDAPPKEDPWARKTLFKQMSTPQLAAMLEDHFSPVVRDKATEEIIFRGADAVSLLKAKLTSSDSEEQRTSAVFALFRIGTQEAVAAAIEGLNDKSAMVKRAAARIAGLAKDSRAVDGLCSLLKDTNASVRRQAATALGQIGDPKAVGPLVAAAAMNSDRFVDHAIIYSLITLGETGPLVDALNGPPANRRRISLITLDQMEDSPLRKSDLAAFLQDKDTTLRKTGMWVAGHHPEWSDLVINHLKGELRRNDLSDAETEMISNLLVRLSSNADVRSFIASQLNDEGVGQERRLLLLSVIDETPGEIPNGWVRVLGELLREENAVIQSRVLGIIQSRRIKGMEQQLDQIAADDASTPSMRMKALGAKITFDPRLSDREFELVRRFTGKDHEPFIRQGAANLLGRADLTDDQLVIVANDLVAGAEAFLLPGLVAAFEGNGSAPVGEALVSALSRASEQLDNLSVESLQNLLKSYPASVSKSAAPLMKTLRERQAARLEAIEAMESSLVRGDVGEGRKLFFGKALCSTCHAVSGSGGTFGPDLTNIGEIRSKHDILEAIMYPGASFAREYETSKVVTKSSSYTGVIKEQVAGSLVLETGPGASVRIQSNEISSILPEDNSLMPPGLDKQLTTQELSDLMTYLTTLPDGMGHLRLENGN